MCVFYGRMGWMIDHKDKCGVMSIVGEKIVQGQVIGSKCCVSLEKVLGRGCVEV